MKIGMKEFNNLNRQILNPIRKSFPISRGGDMTCPPKTDPL
jgi:hypothetical protein